MPVFTIGHGVRSLDELVATLVAAGVGCLVDVRRYPGSRRSPHFGRAALAESLPRAGIAYDFRGDDLGGRRHALAGSSRHPAWRDPSFRAFADYMDTPAFRRALLQLEADAGRAPLAFMCAETLWWQCHRRLIADALALRGGQVIHLLGPEEQRPHALHPDMRPGDDGWPVYDLHVTGDLLTSSAAPSGQAPLAGLATKESSDPGGAPRDAGDRPRQGDLLVSFAHGNPRR